MLKVAKFGGSSVASAAQFKKVRDIVLSDPSRKLIVVSAAGKRDSKDHKITDLLYLCHAHLTYGVPCDDIFDRIYYTANKNLYRLSTDGSEGDVI